MTQPKQIEAKHNVAELENPEFKGYTMSDLRYRRALIAVKRDFTSAALVNDINKIKNRKFFFNGKSFAGDNTWLGKALSGLNYFDYVVLAISTFSSLKKFFSLFNRKK